MLLPPPVGGGQMCRERVPQNGTGWATEQVSFSYWFSTIFMFFVTINCSDYHGFQPVPFWGTLSLETFTEGGDQNPLF
jgi:hypothetical protein